MEHRPESSWPAIALEALAGDGRRVGGARQAVVAMLAAQRCCLSAQELADRIRAAGSRRVGTATVYRTLDLLHREGLVQRVELGDGEARYEPAVPGGEHHHHALCDRCGRLTPFEDAALERAIEAVAGQLRHRVEGHDVLIRGRCERCASGPATAPSLQTARRGDG